MGEDGRELTFSQWPVRACGMLVPSKMSHFVLTSYLDLSRAISCWTWANPRFQQIWIHFLGGSRWWREFCIIYKFFFFFPEACLVGSQKDKSEIPAVPSPYSDSGISGWCCSIWAYTDSNADSNVSCGFPMAHLTGQLTWVLDVPSTGQPVIVHSLGAQLSVCQHI